MSPPTVTKEADLWKAIKRLDSKDVAERASARETIHRAGAEGVRAVAEAMHEEMEAIRKPIRVISSLILGVCYYIVLIPLLLFHLRIDISPAFLLLFLFGIAHVSHLLLSRIDSRLTRRRPRWIEILAESDSVEAIDVLIDIFDRHIDAKTSHAAKTALQRLLPRLRPGDGIVLNRRHRMRLYRWLRPGKRGDRGPGDEALAMAILQWLEQAGEPEALPHVARLARTTQNDRLRLAAQTCLASLQERVELERLNRRLLRRLLRGEDRNGYLLLPSAAPNTPAEILVRPIQPANATETHLLLRPTERSE